MCLRRVQLRIASLLAAVIAAGCSAGHAPSAGSPDRITDVPVIEAQTIAVPDWLEAVGTVRASQTADLAAQIAGNILEVRVHEGDHVRAGRILVVIDDALARAAVDQAVAAQASTQQALSTAESEAALAVSTLRRYQQLHDKKEISDQQFDQVKTRAQSGEAQRDLARAELSRATAALAEARVSLSHAQVAAPFAGLVTQRPVDPGTYASVGMLLLTLEDSSRYRLEAAVNEDDVRSLHIGNHATVTIDALGAEGLSGRIAHIIPSADPSSRSFLVKIALPCDPRLRSGLFGRARFSRGTRSALMIPQTALVSRGQLQAVYVLDSNNVAALRYITVSSSVAQQVEVLSGLESGDRIAASPGDRQLAGRRIEFRP